LRDIFGGSGRRRGGYYNNYNYRPSGRRYYSNNGYSNDGYNNNGYSNSYSNNDNSYNYNSNSFTTPSSYSFTTPKFDILTYTFPNYEPNIPKIESSLPRNFEFKTVFDSEPPKIL
jgi:hypothetical protein